MSTSTEPPVTEEKPSEASGETHGRSRNPEKRRVSISVINFWLDASLLCALLLLGWVSAVLQIVFPAPTLAAGWTLWSLTYDQWRDAQFGLLCVFAMGILIHVMMHWNWVCSVIATQIVRSRNRPDEGMQTIYGVATLIILLHVLAAGVIIALLFVRCPPI
jgi:hypothetical protein